MLCDRMTIIATYAPLSPASRQWPNTSSHLTLQYRITNKADVKNWAATFFEALQVSPYGY